MYLPTKCIMQYLCDAKVLSNELFANLNVTELMRITNGLRIKICSDFLFSKSLIYFISGKDFRKKPLKISRRIRDEEFIHIDIAYSKC